MNQLLRMLMNRLIGHAVNRGMDHLARGGRELSEMSKEERRAYREGKQSSRRARMAMNFARRFWR